MFLNGPIILNTIFMTGWTAVVCVTHTMKLTEQKGYPYSTTEYGIWK